MKRGKDTGSGAEPQPGGGRGGGAEWGRWYIRSAYQCLHLLVYINYHIIIYLHIFCYYLHLLAFVIIYLANTIWLMHLFLEGLLKECLFLNDRINPLWDSVQS